MFFCPNVCVCVCVFFSFYVFFCLFSNVCISDRWFCGLHEPKSYIFLHEMMNIYTSTIKKLSTQHKKWNTLPGCPHLAANRSEKRNFRCCQVSDSVSTKRKPPTPGKTTRWRRGGTKHRSNNFFFFFFFFGGPFCGIFGKNVIIIKKIMEYGEETSCQFDGTWYSGNDGMVVTVSISCNILVCRLARWLLTPSFELGS